MDAASPPPAFGSRTYTITAAGLALVEEIHQFKPGPNETEAAFLLRIGRTLGTAVQIKVFYRQGQIQGADAQRLS